MLSNKNDTFNDRLATAAKAKETMLARFRARPGPDDPALQEQAAARKAVAEAREARQAARKAEREEEARQAVAAKAALAAEKKAEAERVAAEAAAAVRNAATLIADQKAARDARYAARKARQK